MDLQACRGCPSNVKYVFKELGALFEASSRLINIINIGKELIYLKPFFYYFVLFCIYALNFQTKQNCLLPH